MITVYYILSGIPSLAIYDAEDRKITHDGRSNVAADPEGADFPWLPKPLNILNDGTASVINEKPCLVYMTGKSSAASYIIIIPHWSQCDKLGVVADQDQLHSARVPADSV